MLQMAVNSVWSLDPSEKIRMFQEAMLIVWSGPFPADDGAGNAVIKTNTASAREICRKNPVLFFRYKFSQTGNAAFDLRLPFVFYRAYTGQFDTQFFVDRDICLPVSC